MSVCLSALQAQDWASTASISSSKSLEPKAFWGQGQGWVGKSSCRLPSLLPHSAPSPQPFHSADISQFSLINSRRELSPQRPAPSPPASSSLGMEAGEGSRSGFKEPRFQSDLGIEGRGDQRGAREQKERVCFICTMHAEEKEEEMQRNRDKGGRTEREEALHRLCAPKISEKYPGW